MNKSVILRKKIYNFFFLILSFALFFYLFYFLVNGERGFIAYNKIKKEHISYQNKFLFLDNLNNELENKISRLSPLSLDLDYLEEQLNLNSIRNSKNELIINLNN